MGNSPEWNEYNKTKVLSLEKFQEETPKKMTIHILSNKKEDCIKLIEFLTKEKVPNNSLELLEKNIQKKINLYSFMNYKIYEDSSTLDKDIAEIVKTISDNPLKKIFSEVVIILNNDKISDQIKDLRKNNIFSSTNQYYIPFLIIISPVQLNIKGFLRSKIFQYKTTLEGIISNYDIEQNKKLINEEQEEVLKFIKKLNALFSYYNELGDEFCFINTEEKEVPINLEDETNITVFINILLLGRTGSGKSTLINQLLGEKKSLEGGNGFSTTSRKINIYKKSSTPLRFYDVKGIEDEETLENYVKILSDCKGNNNKSLDLINAIFYCMEYKDGTVIEKMEYKLFEKLTKFNIPIIFIITKTPYVIHNESTNPKNTKKEKKIEKARQEERDKMINAIKSIFLEVNKENGQNFIKDYVKFFFVNLKTNISLNIPVFGIDKVLSFFTQSVPKEDWDALEHSCFKNDEKTCLEYCKKNPFLKNYSELENLNFRNKIEAEKYLKSLKAGAFFSGIIPGLDIGMEYLYRSQFKNKLKSLYGFDYDKAEKITKKNNNNIKNEKELGEDQDFDVEGINSINGENTSLITDGDSNKRKSNIKEEEKKIESKINSEIGSTGKNTGSIVRGLLEIGGTIIKVLPTAGEVTLETGVVISRVGINAGLKVVSWAFLPITCIGFGTWSVLKVHKDCQKILKIYEEAFTPLKFETLLAYVKSYRLILQNLDLIGKKLIEEEDDEDEDEEEENEKKDKGENN